MINKLAQAYLMNDEVIQGNQLMTEAEDIYERLMETGLYARSEDEHERWDYLICLKFR